MEVIWVGGLHVKYWYYYIKEEYVETKSKSMSPILKRRKKNVVVKFSEKKQRHLCGIYLHYMDLKLDSYF